MACTTAIRITITDGTATVNLRADTVADAFQIESSPLDEGQYLFRAGTGAGRRYVRYQLRRLRISGGGPQSPAALDALSIAAASWTVTIPSFAGDGTTEQWVVVPPAGYTHTRDVRAGHRWVLEMEEAG